MSPGDYRVVMWKDPVVTVTQAKSPFMQACHREPVPFTPVWFMRQAGRSLPEYRRLREGISMLDSCTRPDLITEITMQPLRRYDVDAAILFSDIVVPLRAVGIDVDIKAGIGPVVETPVRTPGDLERLRTLDPGDVPYVTEAVRTLVTELDERPLIMHKFRTMRVDAEGRPRACSWGLSDP